MGWGALYATSERENQQLRDEIVRLRLVIEQAIADLEITSGVDADGVTYSRLPSVTEVRRKLQESIQIICPSCHRVEVKCSKCGRCLHGYHGSLYCDGTAE